MSRRVYLLSSPLARRFSAAQLGVALALQVGNFVLPWEALQRSDSAAVSALAASVALGGYMLLGIPLGVWVDRTDKRRVLLLLLAAAPLLLAASAWLCTLSGVWVMWPLLALQVLLACCANGCGGALISLGKQHYPQDVLGLAAGFSSLRQVSWFAGLGLGSLLVALAGSSATFAAAAALALLSLLAVLRVPSAPPGVANSVWSGLREVMRVPGLPVTLLLCCLWNLLVGPVFATQVAFLHQTGALSLHAMSGIYWVGGAGSLLAAFTLHWLTAHNQRAPAMIPRLMLPYALAMGAYVAAVMHQTLWALLVWACVMLLNTNLAGLFSGLRSDLVPAELQALAHSVNTAASLAALTAGGLLGSLLVREGIGLLVVNVIAVPGLAVLSLASWYGLRRWYPR